MEKKLVFLCTSILLANDVFGQAKVFDFGYTGQVITYIYPNGLAQKAGLQPGDVLRYVNGNAIQFGNFAISNQLASQADPSTFIVSRAGKDIKITVAKNAVEHIKSKCISGDCSNGFGKSVDSVLCYTYEGNFKHGAYHGHGKLQFFKGCQRAISIGNNAYLQLHKFEGSFNDNRMGFGDYFIIEYRTGGKITGELSDKGLFQGRVYAKTIDGEEILTFSNGTLMKSEPLGPKLSHDDMAENPRLGQPFYDAVCFSLFERLAGMSEVQLNYHLITQFGIHTTFKSSAEYDLNYYFTLPNFNGNKVLYGAGYSETIKMATLQFSDPDDKKAEELIKHLKNTEQGFKYLYVKNDDDGGREEAYQRGEILYTIYYPANKNHGILFFMDLPNLENKQPK